MRAFRAFRPLAVLLAAAALAACGTSAAIRPAAAAARSSAEPTAAGNRALARQEAAHLLAAVPVPSGATPLTPIPGFAQPASQPDVASLVDQARAWRLALPFTAAAAWLRAHPPRHLPAAGSSSGTTGTTGTAGTTGAATQFAEESYRGPAGPAWSSAELDLEVVQAPDGTAVLRADAVVIWLDPVPLRDDAAGPRLRVTVAASCPASDSGAVGVTNRGGTDSRGQAGYDPARRLLPAAAPAAGLECRYYGLNGHAFRLRSATRLDAAQARRRAAALTALPLAHPDGEVTGCPSDDGAATVIALSYPHRPDVNLWIKANGCGFVSNGQIRTLGGT